MTGTSWLHDSLHSLFAYACLFFMGPFDACAIRGNSRQQLTVNEVVQLPARVDLGQIRPV
jgi:hypothetical protein